MLILSGYFDNIPHKVNLIRSQISDSYIMKLIESFLQQGIMDGKESWTPIKGTPQGAVFMFVTSLR